MKVKYILVAILIAALALGGVGCKVTGGGGFTNSAFNQPPNKITFGFNAQVSEEDGTVKGQLQLVDHGTKPPTKVHGTFEGMSVAGNWAGTCTVNGEGPYLLELFVVDAGEPGPDAGDFINIWVDGTLKYSGFLEGGNIQFHKAKKK